ncbi:unnamed protein product [Brachionus calyciflorus]|uniref:Uncharacterized protein n=1 Tax=Brachionus calyciflorus TaxID=104777 RepID=A0A813MMI1_9BILA|nr:unnamed protein product [Brachionus calyciflorus]
MHSVRVTPSSSLNNENFLSLRTNQIDNLIGTPSMRPLSSRMNFLKIDMYPDRFSHIKTTRLEYPTPLLSSQETKANLVNSNTTSPNLSQNETKKKINRRYRDRNSARYMTQPVTLIEIKEIEEDLNESNQITKK